MQRLRTTFKRSRTPTASDMKTQSSLEVPKQVRSASFDEIQLEAKRKQEEEEKNALFGGLLKVPQFNNQRSRSVDSGGSEDSVTYLEVPRRFNRRRSSTKSICIHCSLIEEYAKRQASTTDEESFDAGTVSRSFSFSSDTSSGSDFDRELPECSITVTLSTSELPPPPPTPVEVVPTIENPNIIEIVQNSVAELIPDLSKLLIQNTSELNLPTLSTDDIEEAPPSPRERRRSIQRQEAFFAEPTGTSLENVSDAASEILSEATTSDGVHSEGGIPGLVRDIYLTVPELKRDRAVSVDSCFSKVPSSGKTEELQHSGVSLEVPVSPNVTLRSRSVDIVLPTNEQARYKALAMTNAAAENQKEGILKGKVTVGDATDGQLQRAAALRCTPDWSENATNGDHLWVPTSVSGDFCYVGDTDCAVCPPNICTHCHCIDKHGARLKCSACAVVAHVACLDALRDRVRFTCKPTFRDVSLRQYREQTLTHHHWVHRRSEKGKCKQCSKAFQSKLSFSTKEIVALSCSWCKTAYHNKESCFNIQRIEEECSLGVHSSIIVPPSWIIKLPRKGSFKSSLRKSSKKRTTGSKRSKEKEKDQRTFVIKPIPTATITPVLVFINPKSGGNQGAKLLQKFQWLLNPRQVFDLTQGGPSMGLELFKKVPNLRVLACGGDGTVGWILSVLDQIQITPPPAVAVLPLGTGNDLARSLGWGGGYTDEPITKILQNIGESETIHLDRWSVQVEPNTMCPPTKQDGKVNLPLNVVNNYFSLGVDAHIALEFHEAREAHPERFNSRLRNKMFYGQAGGKDLLRRKWKGLAEFVTLECDGKDLTPKLKEHKVHAIVFLNIASYGGGTHPWNRSGGTSEPSTDDGLIEVVGLTTYQLPLLQAGGHGTCIAQCRSAKIVTSKTIPMQVDGEACKLNPSVITLTLLNKATMLAKRKGGKSNLLQNAILDNIKVNVHRLNMRDYEQHHHDKELLASCSVRIGTIEVNPAADLNEVRTIINKINDDQPPNERLGSDWCFVDSCTAERFFRVDRAQEHLHYVVDIAMETIYILDDNTMGQGSGEGGTGDQSTMPQTPEDETALPSPASNHTTSPTYIIPEMKVNDGCLELSGDPVLSPLSPPTKEITPNVLPPSAGVKIRSIHERLFGINQDSYSYSNLVEKSSDGILKAAKLGDIKLLKELHAQGYSLTTKDTLGQTPLHYAARYGHKDIIKYLIACIPTSAVNQTDSQLGQTALHKAAAGRWRAVCCMLVAGGASLSITDHRGNTPRMLALQANDIELAAYLESQEQFQLVAEDMGTDV